MKFICNGSDLSNATNIVSKAISVTKNIPALEGIKILATENKIVLSAYNQELYIEKTISAEVLLEGEAVLNGKIFNDYANKLSSIEKIEIEKSTDGRIIINYNGNEAEINYFDMIMFPEFGNYDDAESFSIKERDFKELLDRVIFCAAINDTRLLLKSCNIEVKDDKIVEAVCMDSFRIGISKKDFIEKKGRFKAVVLGKIISDITKILSDSDDVIKICKSNNNMVIIDLGHTRIRTSVVDNEFYKYENIIPREINSEIIVNKDEFEESLNRLSIISRETPSNGILLTVEEGIININVKNEKCKGNENIKCKLNGENVVFSINTKYLQDALSRIKEDYLKIKIKNAISPIIVTKIEGDDFICIILPIRTI